MINIDFDREKRTGCPEVIYCEHKSPEQIAQIITSFIEKGKSVMGTRLSIEKKEKIADEFDKFFYDDVGEYFVVGDFPEISKQGKALIIAAGTSDEKVARECYGVMKFFGVNVEMFGDCGVAGIHRLLAHKEKISAADVIIAIAGMEGALPSVVAGMTESPVIAVPTSVGYGTHLNGLTPLFTMLTSCAGGIGVVNIDNGFGAAVLATKIISLLGRMDKNHPGLSTTPPLKEGKFT